MNCCLAYEKIKKEIFEDRLPTKNAGLLLYQKRKKKKVNKHGSGQNVGKCGVCNKVFSRAACSGVSKLGSERVKH